MSLISVCGNHAAASRSRTIGHRRSGLAVRLAAVTVLGLPAFGACYPAMAQTPVLVPHGPDAASSPAPTILAVPTGKRSQRITLAVGKALIVDLPGDAKEVFVGNPLVANAVVRSARRLYVMAVGKGPTTIVALNNDGSPLTTLEINVNARDIGELDAILKTALPGNDIRVQAVYDTIILTGSVASALEAQRAQDIADGFVGYSAESGGGNASNSGTGSSVSFGSTPVIVPGSRPINSLVIRGQDQVMLKVTLVEVRRDIVKQLGVSLSGAWGSVAAGSPAGVVANTATTSASGLSANLTGLKSSLSSTIQALESNGVAHILAEPNVTAISGESAKFQAGGTIPLPVSSSNPNSIFVGCEVTYEQKNYGVTLNFTPTVLSEGRISLHISTQVVEPDESTRVSAGCGSASIVGFRQRQNETTVELPSGGSIVSAGLVQQLSQQTIAGTPGLMNLPILGALFRSRSYQHNETELMIVVTPYLSKPLRPDQISKPDDGFADATDPQSWLLGRMNRIYSTTTNPELIKNYKGRVGFIVD